MFSSKMGRIDFSFFKIKTNPKITNTFIRKLFHSVFDKKIFFNNKSIHDLSSINTTSIMKKDFHYDKAFKLNQKYFSGEL